MAPSSAPNRSFAIRVVAEDRAEEVTTFHKAHITPYLFPRDVQFFENMARLGCLYEVIETTDGAEGMVGVCYITEAREDDGSPRWEFGGVFVHASCRGLGVGSTLGVVAMSSHFVWDPIPATARLIAHVHEHNNEPRAIMTGKLGFVLVACTD
jgi:GNAT superfamily N-acetyltransferase